MSAIEFTPNEIVQMLGLLRLCMMSPPGWNPTLTEEQATNLAALKSAIQKLESAA